MTTSISLRLFPSHSKMRYVDPDLQTINRSRTWCFVRSRKHPSQMASGSSWTEM